MLLEFLINGIVNGSLIALVALGFALIYNTMRVFHIAYAGLYLWAGYLLYYFYDQLHWPLIASFIMALLLTAAFSVVIELVVYKPLVRRDRSENSLMISSVGVLILLVAGVEMLFGNIPVYLDFSTVNALPGGLRTLTELRLSSLVISVLIMSLFFLYMKYSRTGIRIRALRDDDVLSRLYGIRTSRLKLMLYTISGVFAAVAAGLSALDVGINPQLGIPVFINAFVALVIGGVGRFDGPVLGALLLGIMQAMTEYFFDSRWVMMVTFILLIFFLLIRPKGLIPSTSRTF